MAYRPVTREEFDILWDRDITGHPEEPMWPVWRARFADRIAGGQAITFGVILDSDPVGEGTLELNTGKDPRLCNGGDTAYLSALRIRKEQEGQGHISRLVKAIEDYARARGITTLTVGVEAEAARNRAIYRHWGFDRFLFSEEDGQVLYYAKEIKKQ